MPPCPVTINTYKQAFPLLFTHFLQVLEGHNEGQGCPEGERDTGEEAEGRGHHGEMAKNIPNWLKLNEHHPPALLEVWRVAAGRAAAGRAAAGTLKALPTARLSPEGDGVVVGMGSRHLPRQQRCQPHPWSTAGLGW